MMFPEENYEFPGDIVFELPMAQKGGGFYEELSNALEEEDPNRVFENSEAKDFILDYINSPKYLERLQSSGYDSPEDERDLRASQVEGTGYMVQRGKPGLFEQLIKTLKGEPYSMIGSSYYAQPNLVIYDPEQAEEYDIPKSSVLAHEYGHAELQNFTPLLHQSPFRLNDSDVNELVSRLQTYEGQTDHDLEPDENKSDLNALRFELSQQGLYDAGTQDIDKETLRKAESSFIKDRLLRNYSEDDLIWLLNNIAMNNFKQDEFPMARNGLEKYQNLGEVDQVYLGDFTITDADFNALNDPNNPYLCDTDKGCLASAFDAYDAVVGNFHSDFPSEATLKDDLDLQSLNSYSGWNAVSGYKYDHENDQFLYVDNSGNKTPVSQATDEWIRSIPYFKAGDPTIGDRYEGGVYDFTADSWDIHGVLVEKGGLNLLTGRGSFTDLSESERLDLYSKLTPGTIIGFSDEEVDSRADRDGYNKAMGLSSSNHSTIVVGFAEDGVPIVYDFGEYNRLDEGTMYKLKYLDNITIPSNLLDKTRDNLAEDESLNNPPTEFSVNTNYLYDQSKTLFGNTDSMKSFYSALQDNKNQLMLDLKMDNDEYDFIAKTLLGLALSESEGGGGIWFGLEQIGSKLVGPIGDTQGLSQLNINNLLEDEQLAPLAKKYGITSAEDLEDPYKAGIASMLYGWRNNKSAQANFKKGKDAGIRTYYTPEEPEGFKETAFDVARDVVRALQGKDEKFDGETFLTDEGIKVDLTGRFGYRSLEDAQEELDEIAPGKYKVKKDSKGNYYIEKKTEGNSDLSPEQMFIYNWQTPNTLVTGDAQGNHIYVNDTLDHISNFKTGGQNDILSTDFGKSLIQDPRYRKARKQLGADTMARIARILS